MNHFDKAATPLLEGFFSLLHLHLLLHLLLLFIGNMFFAFCQSPTIKLSLF